MDFLDPKKRRSHRIKLFIGYGLMAIALTFASIILLYQSYGYDYDSKTGEVVRNGLIFVEARPSGTEVYLNGEHQGRVNQRLDVHAGGYNLALKKDGYRTWQRDFTLEGGSVEQFVYPLLFPSMLVTAEVQAYKSKPGLLTQSPDRQRLLVQVPGSVKRFNLVDISDKAASSEAVTLPDGLMNGSAGHQLSVVEWSDDDRRLVLKHTYKGGVEFVMVDTEAPANSVNLTERFKTAFTGVALLDKDYDRYYLYHAGSQTLFTANLDDATPNRYQADVLAFSAHGGNEVAYVTKAGASSGKVAVKIREGDKSYLVSEIDANDNYLLNLSRFDGSWYLAARASARDKAYLFQNPVATIKRAEDRQPLPMAILRTPGEIKSLSVSPNSRFVAAQSGDSLAVYDIETDRQHRYDTKLKLPAGQTIGWLDGHRLATVSGKKAVVFDFDGQNQQSLNAALPGYQPFIDNNYRAIFTLSTSAKAKLPALVRTEL